MQIGSAEEAGKDGGRRRKRSRATGNEDKEMRWSTTSQGVVTGSGPSACPKEAKRLNRGLWEAWHAKPLLLSASKKILFHTYDKSLKGKRQGKFGGISQRPRNKPHPMLTSPLASRPHLAQKVGWQPCRGARIGGHKI